KKDYSPTKRCLEFAAYYRDTSNSVQVAEIAVFGFGCTGGGHNTSDIDYFDIRPHHFCLAQPRIDLFTTRGFSSVLLELALCGDCDITRTLLRLLLFHSSEKYLEIFGFRRHHSTGDTGCSHRIRAGHSAACSPTSRNGGTRS